MRARQNPRGARGVPDPNPPPDRTTEKKKKIPPRPSARRLNLSQLYLARAGERDFQMYSVYFFSFVWHICFPWWETAADEKKRCVEIATSKWIDLHGHALASSSIDHIIDAFGDPTQITP